MENLEHSMPLGALLIDHGLITEQQLVQALDEQKRSGELLGVVLLRLGFLEEEQLFLPILAGQLGYDYVDVSDLVLNPEVLNKIPAKYATQWNVLPIACEGETLTVAAHHPGDLQMIDVLETAWPGRIKMVLAGAKDLAKAIGKYYGIGAETIDAMMGQRGDEPAAVGPEVDNLTEIESEASIAKFINQLLREAHLKRATDIHIEPYEQQLKIRYRIDGVLVDVHTPSNIWFFREAINSRIKILSNLNIAEKRRPQDGRFQVKAGEVDLDLRVSFLPTSYGESVVIRILSSNKLYDFSELGLSPTNLAVLDRLVRRPYGIIFVTGPTGSGKTTTLYSCLARINHAQRKIITIEDPIEYQLPGVVQLQINPILNFTFASGLRSMLRHDPDVMMVGEVRDHETAEIAIQIAMTGHLVFSTLHTNDAVSGIARLIDMGVEPYMVANSVHCFIAQRLVRRICPGCKTAIPADPALVAGLGLDIDPGSVTVYRGQGCAACGETGFYGREGIYEFLVLNEEMKEMIVRKASVEQIRSLAAAKGMTTMAEDGWDKVQRGITTIDEVLRVTREETA